MSDEIKIQHELNILKNTILDDTTYKPTISRRKLLVNYITNLQQENEELKKKLDRRYYKNEYERIKQENESLKEYLFKSANNTNMIMALYADCNSRIEKTIELYQTCKEEDWCTLPIDMVNVLQNGIDENVSDRD